MSYRLLTLRLFGTLEKGFLRAQLRSRRVCCAGDVAVECVSESVEN
jgi:hypothetical protein